MSPREHLLDTDPRAGIDARSPVLGADDRLGLIYASPGPYVSVYMQIRPDFAGRWDELRGRLEHDGASSAALDAVDARLGLPVPPDVAAVGVIASADGKTIVDHSLEPPRADLAVVDTLPYAAPLIEWDQRRVPHLVVVADEAGIDIVEFHPDHRSEMASMEGSAEELTEEVSRRARALDCRLVVVGGSPAPAQRIADDLVPLVAPRCDVVVELDETTDGLAEATVRHVSDAAATSTVGFLREFRFLAEHDSAVDGMEATIAALRSAHPGVLLIHDDPTDDRRVWIGPHHTDLSIENTDGWTETARFVDAAIRTATMSGLRIHVIPSTGRNGPTDGAAVIDRGAPSLEAI